MELAAYLRRIAYDGPLAVDAPTLAALHRAHLLAVPFENLDIGWGRPIVLDPQRHYAKIVEQRRGGFCYEQNALFAWALDRIGFRTTALGAGVWATRGDITGFGDPTSHRLTRVDLDEPWIADVGFGENFRTPLRLVDGLVQRQARRAYRLDRRVGSDPGTWTLSSCDPQAGWTPSYRFDDIALSTDAFARMCRFHQTSPDSPFTGKRLCSLATEDGGRVTLSGDEWIVTAPDGSRWIEAIRDEHQAADLLGRFFHIEMPAPRQAAGKREAMSETTYRTITFASGDGIARLTLNRPDKLNAFSAEMFEEMRDVLDRVESAAADGGVRVLVVTGAGRGFCAGADLAAIDPATLGDRDLGLVLERDYNPFVLKLRSLPVPVLCAINGVAAGAGASLALAGDIAIATRSASFVLAFARIGLVPDAGSTFFLPQRIGKARALGLAMLGEKIDAATAERWGLIWECVDDADFATRVEALATRLAAAPTRALVATRALIDRAQHHPLVDQLDAERSLQARMGGQPDFAEGVTAFRDKRPAVFRG